MRDITITLELKEWNIDSDIVSGELFIYNDEIYQFDGYEYGVDAYATNIKTKDQISLPN